MVFKHRRIVVTSVMAALLVSVASSGPQLLAKPASISPPDRYSPVRCRVGDDEVRPMAAGGYHAYPQSGAAVAPNAAPPPRMARDSAKMSTHAVPQPGIMPPRPYPYPQPHLESRERYAGKDVAAIHAVAQEPVSTFSVDVDTGSYANVRRFLRQGQLPPQAAVRTEEMLNYFRYDYPNPADRSRPFSVTTDMATTPWNANTRLLRVGIRGFDIPRSARPPANLVFLVDVSGSMYSQDKLPLVKSSLSLLADRLSPQDRVSIVVYAGAAGIVLEPTNQKRHIIAALDCLQAGGSTTGGQGMELAYATAKAHFIKGGVNRVIMTTDGDFNVGISSNEGIEAIVKRNREAGITLTTLGYGQGNLNEAMMERVADIGNGNYAYIDSAIEAQKVLDEEMAATLFTIAKDVKIQLEFNPAVVREYRLIGYENRALAEEDFDNDKVDAGDIGAGHQVTALYEVAPAGGKGWLPDRHFEANRITSAPKVGQMGWLKLRYKLPDGDRSMLIEQPIASSQITTARAPQGDMAFATAVAAFGQKLRGDKYLGNFGFSDIRRLAGAPKNYLREEFVKLTEIAGSRSGTHTGEGGDD
jgi:Ca-activated chloride channel homolog